jgi:hypothetical protein
MKSKISISRLQLYIIILFPLFVDLIIGIGYYFDINLNIGKIFRGSLYVAGLTVSIMKNRFHIFHAILFFWSLLFLFWLIFSENFNVSRELTFFFKTTYIFPILFLLENIKIKKKVLKVKILFILKTYSQTIAGFILFSFFTGIGLQTYGSWVFGTTSFFIAQNDIGLSQLLIFSLLLFNKEKFKISWFWLSLIFLSLILLGTTTGMFGSLLIVFLFIFLKLILSQIVSIRNLIFRLIASISLVLLFFASSFFLFNYIKNSNYYSIKYEQILETGVRSRLTNAANTYLETRNFVFSFFGEGHSSFTTNFGNSAKYLKDSKKDYKDWLLVETDLYDFYGSYGIILSLIFVFFYIHILLLAIINYLNKKDIYTVSLLMVVFFAIIHGLFAGHVFYSPTVLGIFAGIIFLIKMEYGKFN